MVKNRDIKSIWALMGTILGMETAPSRQVVTDQRQLI
jgi:hypothetical protein